MKEEVSPTYESDIGTGELFVLRFLAIRQILTQLGGPGDRRDAESLVLNVLFEGLDPAFRSLRAAREVWRDTKIPEREKKQHVEGVYFYLTIAFKDRFQEVAKKLGYEIGHIFQRDAVFEVEVTEFAERHPKIGENFAQIARALRAEWLTKMIRVRNDGLEHAGGKGTGLVAELKKHLTLEEVEDLFDSCWRSMEDIIFLFALDKHDERRGTQLLETSEYEANKNAPQRFGWFLVPNHPANQGNA